MIQRSSPISHKFRPLRRYIYRHSERILAASYSTMSPLPPLSLYAQWLVRQTVLMKRPADERGATHIETGRRPAALPVQTIPPRTKIGDEVLAALRGSRRAVKP